MSPRPAPSTIPPRCGLAFKEWSGVCHALATGAQSLILRKGGVSETSGPGRFEVEHPAFWLFPTRLHERQQGLKVEPPPPDPERAIALDTLAVVERVHRVEDLDRLDALDALHVWTAATIHRRFHYRSPGLWVLGVRVFQRPEPFRIEPDPAFDGCKSWVPLGLELSTAALAPVLDVPEHQARMRALDSALGSGTPARGGATS